MHFVFTCERLHRKKFWTRVRSGSPVLMNLGSFLNKLFLCENLGLMQSARQRSWRSCFTYQEHRFHHCMMLRGLDPEKRERNGQKMFFDSVKLQLTAQITAIFFKSHLRLQLDLVITCDTRCFRGISPSKFRLGLGIHDWELGTLFRRKCFLTVTRKWDFSRDEEVDSSAHSLNGNQTFLLKYFAFCHDFCLIFHKWRKDWEPGHMWTTVTSSSPAWFKHRCYSYKLSLLWARCQNIKVKLTFDPHEFNSALLS